MTRSNPSRIKRQSGEVNDDIPSYIGMDSEAAALEAALNVIRRGEEDEFDEAVEKAYKSVTNEYCDDDVKNQALLRFFRSDPHLFEVSAT